MDTVGLPLLGPNVEYSTVPPIETNRILNYFNQFVTSTVHVLNKFAVICDRKLMNLDFRLQDVEATLTILEEKLASAPSSGIVELPTLPALLPTVVETAPPPSVQQEQAPNAESSQQEAPECPVNPDISRFVKMLAVGVPQLAVEQKMRAEGFDPALLHSTRMRASHSTNQPSDSSDVMDTDNSEE